MAPGLVPTCTSTLRWCVCVCGSQTVDRGEVGVRIYTGQRVTYARIYTDMRVTRL